MQLRRDYRYRQVYRYRQYRYTQVSLYYTFSFISHSLIETISRSPGAMFFNPWSTDRLWSVVIITDRKIPAGGLRKISTESGIFNNCFPEIDNSHKSNL